MVTFMTTSKAASRLAATLLLAFSIAHAQNAPSVIQQAVDAERTANQNDHSNWSYLEDVRKPKEHIIQWVAATQQGDVRRVWMRNEQKVPEPDQRDQVQKFLHDPKAQKKAAAESAHDTQQVDDFLKLLPVGFRWTTTNVTATSTYLHFEPDPGFHAPTREARVFSGMVGDLIVDNQEHRIQSMSGHLVHDVLFGAGLLGRLKEGSSFSLEQAQVGPALWQLKALHVHLDGNALLFKSISLEEDDERSRFEPQPANLTLDTAGAAVMAEAESQH